MSADHDSDFSRGFELALAANQLQHCVEKFDKESAREILRKNALNSLLESTGQATSNHEQAGFVEQYNLAVNCARSRLRLLY